MPADNYHINSDSDLFSTAVKISEMEIKYPIQMVIKPTRDSRSKKQNRLLWQWINDLAKHGDQSTQEYRAQIKLYHGVPIMRAASEDFREGYDKHIKHLPVETKLALMSEPWDFPVTSLMDTEQMKEMLDRVWITYRAEGYPLTDPELLGIESYEGIYGYE